MRTSEQTNEISTALARAQGKLNPAPKDASNPFFKSKYANLAMVMDAAKEPLSSNGLSVTQITSKTASGDWVLVTRLSHSSGQWIEGEFPLYYKDQTSQAVGSAVSYARRYSLASIVGVVQDDDDGESSVGRKYPIPISDKQIKEFDEFQKNELGISDKFAQHFNKAPVEDLIKSVAPKPTPMPQNPVVPKRTSSVPHTHTGPQLVTEAQVIRLHTIAGKSGWLDHEVSALVRERYKKSSRKDLLRDEYDEVIHWIQTTPPPSVTEDLPV